MEDALDSFVGNENVTNFKHPDMVHTEGSPLPWEEWTLRPTSGISIVLCVLALATFVYIRVLRPHLANRVSLRLATTVTFCDLIVSISLLINSCTMKAGPKCSASMYLYLAFSLLSAFGTAAIALNLLLVFVLKFHGNRWYERGYYIAAVVFGFGIPLITLTTGHIGYDFGECWIIVPVDQEYVRRDYLLWLWGSFYVWISLVIVFCTGCTITVWRSLRKSTGLTVVTTTSTSSTGTANTRTDCLIRQAVSRIALYCLVPLFGQLFNIILDLLPDDVDERTARNMVFLSNLFGGLQGAFNAIIFFGWDPAVRRIWDEIRYSLVKKYYLPYVSFASFSLGAWAPTNSSLTSSTTHNDVRRVAPWHDSTSMNRNTRSSICHVMRPAAFFPRLAYNMAHVLLLREEDLSKYAREVDKLGDPKQTTLAAQQSKVERPPDPPPKDAVYRYSEVVFDIRADYWESMDRQNALAML